MVLEARRIKEMTQAFACITDSPHIRPQRGNGHLQVVPGSFPSVLILPYIGKDVNLLLAKREIMEKLKCPIYPIVARASFKFMSPV